MAGCIYQVNESSEIIISAAGRELPLKCVDSTLHRQAQRLPLLLLRSEVLVVDAATFSGN